MEKISSWGNNTTVTPDLYQEPYWLDQIHLDSNTTQLACGLRRSYGDSCLLAKGSMIDMRHCNRIIQFDPIHGILHAEAGISFKQILDLVVPQGWMIPVVPGTQYVTLGGAIANDIHGKNHHYAGNFGCHVKHLSLLRSDYGQIDCSLTQHASLFRATIGGLGLTGLITSASIQLMRIPSDCLRVETIAFDSFNHYLAIEEASAQHYQYTAAWLDLVANKNKYKKNYKTNNTTRGIYFRANFATPEQLSEHKILSSKLQHSASQFSVPFTVPTYLAKLLLNRYSLRAHNQYYYWRQASKQKQIQWVPYKKFFFPLDHIKHWYRLYGPQGLQQYQCVFPTETQQDGISELLQIIQQTKLPITLAVAKRFGNIKSPGFMAFTQAGTTLAMDMVNQTKYTIPLFKQLNQCVLKYQGKLYPAKDAQLSSDIFQQMYQPQLNLFSNELDPAFSSAFWQRVMPTMHSRSNSK